MIGNLDRCGFTAALLFIALPSTAHHSTAMYDTQHELTLHGVVTRFDWTNPHVYILIETEGETDEKAVWTIEASPPIVMSRIGWSPGSLAPDDRVVVDAFPLRNSPRRMVLGKSILKADKTLLVIRDESGDPFSPTEQPAPSTIVASDLSGRWLPLTTNRVVIGQFIRPASAWSLTEKGIAAVESYDGSENPAKDCIEEAAPYTMIWPNWKNIEIGEELVSIVFDDGGSRTIHMDVDSHDRAPYTLGGHSIGWWEGDVLVVDTTHFSEHRNGHGVGLSSSRQKHVVERFELGPDRTRLTYSFWAEDPEYLTEPVTGSLEWAYRPDIPATSVPPCDPEVARRYLDE